MARTKSTKPKTKLWIRAVLLSIGMTLTLSLAGCAIVPYSPKIRDEEGIVIPGSIVSLEKVVIGGVEQWLLIRGKSKTNPILLVLHGGPGSPEGPLIAHYNKELEEYLTGISAALESLIIRICR